MQFDGWAHLLTTNKKRKSNGIEACVDRMKRIELILRNTQNVVTVIPSYSRAYCTHGRRPLSQLANNFVKQSAADGNSIRSTALASHQASRNHTRFISYGMPYIGRTDGHKFQMQRRYFSDGDGKKMVINVPHMGDSISEGVISEWKKKVGESIKSGDVIAVIETDKIAVDVVAPESGVLAATMHGEGDNILVGTPLYEIELGAVGVESSHDTAAPSSPAASTEATPPAPEPKVVPQPPPTTRQAAPELKATPSSSTGDIRGEKRTPMSRIRLRIAERLKGAQNTAASLTTFNECDMGNLMALRSEMNDSFQEAHDVKLGFVSAFLMASALSLGKYASLNAYIEGTEIVYKDYMDISVAVATPTGLLVPVIRDCEKKTWDELEHNLMDLAKRARTNQIALEEMSGGTFTVSNGGVYGSMLGTPLLNLPQSSILGMHAITKRPVVVDNEIVIRPMMYLALTYDHRLIDGREAVLFLNSIKHYIENPVKMLLKV